MRSRPSPAASPTSILLASSIPAWPAASANRPCRVATAALVAVLLFALTPLPAAAPASAALIATGTGSENAWAPDPDPGFARVGVVNGLSGVYFRNGWVLTANHVGIGSLLLDGTTYPPVPDSTVRMRNPDGTLADLIAFKLSTPPPLPDIELPDGPPTSNALITVIGNGRNRGTATDWEGVDGWNWLATRAIRWGTNRISTVDELVLSTRAFSITFDDIPNPPNGQHEADVVNGDSGGGAFVGSGANAELVGILFARASFVGQPANTSLFGNRGFIADLFAYRDDLLAVVDQPDCDDGLDDDGDGLIDFPEDPGCAFANDPSEKTGAFECDNGIDDDGDRAIDFPADSGCLHPSNPIEAPEPGAAPSLAAAAIALAIAARRRNVTAGSGRPGPQTSSTRSTR